MKPKLEKVLNYKNASWLHKHRSLIISEIENNRTYIQISEMLKNEAEKENKRISPQIICNYIKRHPKNSEIEVPKSFKKPETLEVKLEEKEEILNEPKNNFTTHQLKELARERRIKNTKNTEFLDLLNKINKKD